MSLKWVKRIYLSLVFAFLYAPILVLIAFSFNESRSRAVWTGFTLDWYVELFNDRAIMQALQTTLMVAVISAIISTIIGTSAAIGINVLNKRPKKIVLNITNLPVLNPEIVTGISLMILYLWAFNTFNMGRLGFMTVLLSHITFNIPYVILSVLPKLRQLDKNLYEAALDLGASPLFAFFRVIMPEIRPGIISGAILAFTLSLDDFVITFFTTGPGVNTLSTIIYSMARRGINPKINALSTIMFAAVLILIYFINREPVNNKKNVNKGDL